MPKPKNDKDNCLNYSIDEMGPLGKMIKDITLQTETFIVFLDYDDVIQWYTVGHENFNGAFGAISNKISYWESVSNKIFSRKEAYDYKGLLSEAYARILDDQNPRTANAIIETTVERMKKHGNEVLKQAYVLSAFICTCVIMISLMVLSVLRDQITPGYISSAAFDIILTSLFGGVGAFVFVVLRLIKYVPAIEISKQIHRIDGSLRIFYGVISGLIISIAIKANVVFGFLKDVPDKTIYLSVFLGIIAGASEVIIPSLIRQIESTSKDV